MIFLMELRYMIIDEDLDEWFLRPGTELYCMQMDCTNNDKNCPETPDCHLNKKEIKKRFGIEDKKWVPRGSDW